MNNRILKISTKYFTWQELLRSNTAVRLHIDNVPKTDNVITNLISLSYNLSYIRERFGKPILVNSGYRCYDLNKAVGGVANSKHMLGKAADIRCGTINYTYELFIFLDHAKYDFIDKIIWEKGSIPWIHLQIK